MRRLYPENKKTWLLPIQLYTTLQYMLHCAVLCCTAHCILHTAHFTLCTLNCKLHALLPCTALHNNKLRRALWMESVKNEC